MDILQKTQNRLLEVLAGKIDDFYLSGGTALSRYYFQHRLSGDLDFFTSKFSRRRIEEVKGIVARSLNKKIELYSEQLQMNQARMVVFYVHLSKKNSLRIDFVEDYFKNIKPLKNIEGIFVHSLEDIYMRKIYTLIGTIPKFNSIGRLIPSGREEAKDYYDIYVLSSVSQPLSNFAKERCSHAQRISLIRWFRTYDRMKMKTGLLEMKSKTPVDTRKVEEHFTEEIGNLLEEEVDFFEK
jgi:predicted nucleotidyltransferase component of viral defense system